MDGRNRTWVAVGVHFTSDGLGQKLRREFGNEGLAVWVALLAAAKRYPVEGMISYSNDADLWGLLGVDPPAFTADAFFKVTGAHHETRRSRRSGLMKVTLTNWDDLQRRRPRPSDDRSTTTRRRTNDASTTSKDPGQGAELRTTTRQDKDKDSDSDSEQVAFAAESRSIEEEKSSDEFAAFVDARALAEVRRRQSNGKQIDNPSGYARTIASDPDFIAETERVLSHRDCPRCGGEGMVEEYATGAGMVRFPCPANVVPDPPVHEDVQ